MGLILASACKSLSLIDRVKIRNIMKTSFLIHNMIVKLRREGYESELFEECSRAIENGMFIDSGGEEKKFSISTIDEVCVFG